MEPEGWLAVAALLVSLASAASQVLMWRRERATRLSVQIVPYTTGANGDSSLAGLFVEVINLSSHPVPLAGVSLRDEEMDDTAHLLALRLEGKPTIVEPLDAWRSFLTADDLRDRLIDLPEGRVSVKARQSPARASPGRQTFDILSASND